MGQASKKSPDRRPLKVHVNHGLREAGLFVLGAVALYLMIALVSFNPNDPGWSHTGLGLPVSNMAGSVGAWFADVFYYLLGYLAFLSPLMMGYSAWLVFRGHNEEQISDWRVLGVKWSGFFITLLAGCGLATMHFATGDLPLNAGGVLGLKVSELLVPAFSLVGATLLLLAMFFAGITVSTGLSWLTVMDMTGQLTLNAIDRVRGLITALKESRQVKQVRQEREAMVKQDKEKKAARQKPKPRIEPVISKAKPSARVEKEKQITLFGQSNGNTSLPAISLLDKPSESGNQMSEESLEAVSRQVELKLADFNIEAEVVAVHPGPVITRFELQPAAGTKASKVVALSKDLARALSVVSVRIVEVIPGKPTMGLEIPNEQREIVSFSEIIASEAYDKSTSPLTLALGKGISGQAEVADLAKMPHLLVAGTTGAGKSVAVNAMLLSLLYKSTPQQARLILIDPKMLELSVYDGIPHLLAPVVTDMKEAANGLRWAVGEMERRYRLMSAMGVRNMAGFNRKIQDAIDAGTPLTDPLYKPEEHFDTEAPPPELETLPFIVIVVDEFADMMMVVGKKVEELIARLAQKARAAGIHLILATQRPSVDVITGLIKANIPSRIAFQVSSKIDSRTILDQMGAEQLLGHGDMLYLPSGKPHPTRIHGAFVSDQEVHRVVDELKKIGEPKYIDGVLEEQTGAGAAIPGIDPIGNSDSEMDALYDEAVAIVTETRKASISYVQRRLKIGYNRAARMIEDMEASGVISPVQSNGSREVLAPPPIRD